MSNSFMSKKKKKKKGQQKGTKGKKRKKEQYSNQERYPVGPKYICIKHNHFL